MSVYVLPHDNPVEEGRLGLLSSLLDPYVRFRLETLGLAKGWACLEVGAGNGSMSRWIAECIGPSGRVVCTDLETSFLDRIVGNGIEVRPLDLVRDPILQQSDGSGFDLILARNVLHHLPERNEVISRLTGALKPGGLLVVMEPDIGPMWACTIPEWVFYWRAFCAWSESRDIDYKLGRSLALRLSRAGLEAVESYGETAYLQGGRDTPTLAATGFYRDTALAIGPQMVADGFIDEDALDAFIRLMDRPGFRAAGYDFTMTWGRKPAVGSRAT
ncbi:methyltransferase family protein [Breoghania corrubedonensis]|uniref:Methyltransferase family protein n=1 Tax=Breoghania corrubedonensis TaxID=665038 RepID=A0A2T5VFM3_9HYPH|nr:methyltransferase [Breoghania corrubedonensis]PTW62550.1 methyltransferase family protein [Breoghania corrubedonensis]